MSDGSSHAPRSAAPTLQDVAAAAGVSLATASRVLNGSTRTVAQAYRERVQAAADELGYTANISAQTTAKGTSPVVALLVADIADPYFAQIAAGVGRGADENGLILTIAITNRDRDRELRLLRALRGQRPRGVILAASRTTESLASDIQEELQAHESRGGHVVALGGGSGVGTSVGIDNVGGARHLGEAMIRQGYRRAVVIGAAEGVRTSDDRIAGFTTGFTAGGGVIDEVYRGAFTRDAGHDVMASALERGVAPGTVVFGVNDVVAIGALTAIRAAGRQCGDDVALAGFDDIPTSRDVSPALTTVRVPLEQLGYEALRAVVDPDVTSQQRSLDLQLIVRESTPVREPE